LRRASERYWQPASEGQDRARGEQVISEPSPNFLDTRPGRGPIRSNLFWPGFVVVGVARRVCPAFAGRAWA
jgi:hypothetical protein